MLPKLEDMSFLCKIKEVERGAFQAFFQGMKLMSFRSPILFISILFAATSAHALVDYTEQVPSQPNVRAPKRSAPRSVKRMSNPRNGSSNLPSGAFELGSQYESQNVDIGSGDGTVSMINFNGHFQTPYNIFLDFAFWGASTDDVALSDSSSIQAGNPTVALGFNWLQFGKTNEMATIDLYGGLSIRGNSAFASSRTDKIVGVETTKRFYAFALALGYELRLTGTPDKVEELDIGNIHKLSATVGWMVSHDIQFAVEGATIKVNNADATGRVNFLAQETSFAYVAPKLGLSITPQVQFELGAKFRTKRADGNGQNLAAARLWDLQGSYGNTIFGGLNFSI